MAPFDSVAASEPATRDNVFENLTVQQDANISNKLTCSSINANTIISQKAELSTYGTYNYANIKYKAADDGTFVLSVKPDNNVDSFITFQKDEIFATTNAGFLTPLILDRVEIKDDLSLNILKVSNGSSAGASDGDVLTVSGSTMRWEQPSASLPSASFSLTTHTASLPANTISTVSGEFTNIVNSNSITNNDNGTFTINEAGIYLINMTIDFQRSPSFISTAQIYLTRNRNGNVDRLSRSVKNDSSTDETELNVDICYVDSFLENDNIVMEGNCDQVWQALGFASNPQDMTKTHINFVKLS